MARARRFGGMQSVEAHYVARFANQSLKLVALHTSAAMAQSDASSSVAAFTLRRMVPDPSSRTATFAFADDLDRPLLAGQRLSSDSRRSTWPAHVGFDTHQRVTGAGAEPFPNARRVVSRVSPLANKVHHAVEPGALTTSEAVGGHSHSSHSTFHITGRRLVNRQRIQRVTFSDGPIPPRSGLRRPSADAGIPATA